ncbi:MAG: PDZ domain-containing protein [Planctomycetes bacterium]|nr:PDZ domain-containing protein [Planctomycetota bacterium]
MDNVDINLFKADPDLTMHMFFLNASGYVYSRYGQRKDGKSETMMSVEGIRDAMRKVLDIHRKEASKTAPPWKPFDTQDLLSFKRDPRRPGGCLHCHHAGYYLRKEEFMVGRLNKETVWGFPLPDNLGIVLDIDRNTVVKEASGLAEKAGMQAGDRVVTVDGKRVVTPADFIWILNAFKGGTLKVVADREGKSRTFSFALKGGDWRKTNISWRQSWWDSGPDIGLEGEDLSADERKALGLSEDAIAIRVTKLKSGGAAAGAGVKTDDVVVGVDRETKDMEAIELLMHVRLKFRVGESMPLTVLRGKQRIGMNVKFK